MTVLFSYTARSDKGIFVSGSLEADSNEQALAHLRTRSLFVTSLEQAESLPGFATRALSWGKVDPSAKVSFFRSFATMIGSGVAMQRALTVAIEQCRDARFREALKSVACDVESGTSLSGAMSRRSRDFAPLFIALVGAGELGGVLHEALDRLAGLLESDRAMRKRVTAALAYPAMVTVAAIALVLFLVANVVPTFAGMFGEMHMALPLSTRVLIALGSAMQLPLVWAMCVALPIAIAALRVAARSTATAHRLNAIVLGIPLFGPLLRKVVIARFARTLGTLLRSGVEVIAALEASVAVLESAVYARCARNIIASLRLGDPIIRPLDESGLFDALFLQLVRVGEETGAVDAMLLRVAEYYELDIETSISTIGSILEPLMIVVLGSIVGTIVASILIPLYSIIGSIK